jgi:hypothetical protein
MNDQLFEEQEDPAMNGPLSIEALQAILLTKV